MSEVPVKGDYVLAPTERWLVTDVDLRRDGTVLYCLEPEWASTWVESSLVEPMKDSDDGG